LLLSFLIFGFLGFLGDYCRLALQLARALHKLLTRPGRVMRYFGFRRRLSGTRNQVTVVLGSGFFRETRIQTEIYGCRRRDRRGLVRVQRLGYRLR
jgi:hypothetical protein